MESPPITSSPPLTVYGFTISPGDILHYAPDATLVVLSVNPHDEEIIVYDLVNDNAFAMRGEEFLFYIFDTGPRAFWQCLGYERRVLVEDGQEYTYIIQVHNVKHPDDEYPESFCLSWQKTPGSDVRHPTEMEFVKYVQPANLFADLRNLTEADDLATLHEWEQTSVALSELLHDFPGIVSQNGLDRGGQAEWLIEHVDGMYEKMVSEGIVDEN